MTESRIRRIKEEIERLKIQRKKLDKLIEDDEKEIENQNLLETIDFSLTLEQFLTINDLVYGNKIGDYGNKDKTINDLMTIFSRDKMDYYPNEEADKIRNYVRQKKAI